jgi:hypothetical protein
MKCSHGEPIAYHCPKCCPKCSGGFACMYGSARLRNQRRDRSHYTFNGGNTHTVDIVRAKRLLDLIDSFGIRKALELMK